MAESKATYRYGVAHVNHAQVSHVQAFRTRPEAEDDLAVCQEELADCYLIRWPFAQWERVPDGE